MPGRRRCPKLKTIWPDVNATLGELWTYLERLDSWTFGPGFDVDDNDAGRRVSLNLPDTAKIAKTGGTAIPAMSGSTPGSGAITLYGFDGTSLVAGPADVGKNLATGADGAVAANTWIIVNRIDGYWFIVFEICPA